MGDGREHAPGRGTAVGEDSEDAVDAGSAAVGKRTLTAQRPIDGAGGGTPGAQPVDSAPGAAPAETMMKKPTISGTIVGGGPLSDADVDAIDNAAKSVPKAFRRYVAYDGVIKVGGSLAWRANNPGNLRDADTKIGSVKGAVGSFAVFATMDAGRAAQRALYLNKYGAMSVRDAVNKLTPPSENDTATYLNRLAAAGVDLDGTVSAQIDVLMPAVEANEGMIAGVEIARSGG